MESVSKKQGLSNQLSSSLLLEHTRHHYLRGLRRFAGLLRAGQVLVQHVEVLIVQHQRCVSRVVNHGEMVLEHADGVVGRVLLHHVLDVAIDHLLHLLAASVVNGQPVVDGTVVERTERTVTVELAIFGELGADFFERGDDSNAAISDGYANLHFFGAPVFFGVDAFLGVGTRSVTVTVPYGVV